MKMFCRPRAGEDDFHVLVRAQACQTNHLSGQVDDLYRRAHVEHIDLPDVIARGGDAVTAAVGTAGKAAVRCFATQEEDRRA